MFPLPWRSLHPRLERETSEIGFFDNVGWLLLLVTWWLRNIHQFIHYLIISSLGSGQCLIACLINIVPGFVGMWVVEWDLWREIRNPFLGLMIVNCQYTEIKANLTFRLCNTYRTFENYPNPRLVGFCFYFNTFSLILVPVVLTGSI